MESAGPAARYKATRNVQFMARGGEKSASIPIKEADIQNNPVHEDNSLDLFLTDNVCFCTCPMANIINLLCMCISLRAGCSQVAAVLLIAMLCQFGFTV